MNRNLVGNPLQSAPSHTAVQSAIDETSIFMFVNEAYSNNPCFYLSLRSILPTPPHPSPFVILFIETQTVRKCRFSAEPVARAVLRAGVVAVRRRRWQPGCQRAALPQHHDSASRSVDAGYVAVRHDAVPLQTGGVRSRGAVRRAAELDCRH